MKWDMMDITLPWRHLVSECIRNGVFPFWNPYMNGGFPQMGDGSTWYPIAWIIGLIRPYTPASIQYEFLIHLILAGWGMYKLMRWWNISKQASLIGAIYFSLNGFMIGNAQHLGYAAGAAWLPWLIWLFDRYLQSFRWQLMPPIFLVSFCMITGVYPGIVIVVVYLLIALLIIRLIQQIRAQTFVLKKWFNLINLGIGVIMISSVFLLGLLDLTPLINRTQGLSLDGDAWGILTGSLPWKAILSVFTPMAVTIQPDFWGADLALVNCFAGGLTWMFILLGVVFFRRMPKSFWAYFLLAIFFYMTAMAQDFPVRKMLYHTLPLMDLFRFSTLFRMFATFFSLLAFGNAFDALIKDRKALMGLAGITAVLTLALIVEAFWVERWMIRDFFLEGYFRFDEVAGIKERVYLEQFFVWLFLVGSVVLIYTHRLKWLTGLVVLEIILFTQLNIYSTVIENRAPDDVEARLKEMPKGFPIPNLDQSLAENNDITLNNIPYLWKNLAIYQKIPTIDGCSPYGLTLMDQSRELGHLEPISQMPLVFTGVEQNGLILPDSAAAPITIHHFDPNEIRLEVKMEKPGRLVFNQNFHKSWMVRVDGERVENLPVNTNINSVQLDAGTHEIKYWFNPALVRMGFFVSLFWFLISVVTWMVNGLLAWKKGLSSETEF
ncbi:hypothetical protein KFE98_07060 [bacterium SCSIO 12741]|nr:hypothetical protein KFE98_07060 [bacterium SCSIO 12741]